MAQNFGNSGVVMRSEDTFSFSCTPQKWARFAYKTFTALVELVRGTITVSADGSFDYTPPTDWTGDDEFDITISDAITSITVTIVIRVTS